MSFNPVYDDVYAEKSEFYSSQTVVEATLKAPIGKIASVLSVCADAGVADHEAYNGEIKVSGEVIFNALYLTEEGETSHMTCKSPFTVRLEANTTPESRICVWSEVLDTDVVSVSGDEIKVACAVDVKADETEIENIKYLSPESEGIFCDEDTEKYSTVKYKGNHVFESEESEETPLDEIFYATACVYTTRRSAIVDGITVGGAAVVTVVGKRGGFVDTQTVRVEWEEEAEAAGARSDDEVEVTATIVNCAATIENEDKKSLKVSVSVNLCYRVRGESSFAFVTNAFSPESQLLTTTESHVICPSVINYSVSDRVQGGVTLEADMPPCDDVLALCGFKATVSSYATDGDALKVEGVVSGNVIYFCSDGDKVSSVAVSVPYSLKLRSPSGGETANIRAAVSDVSARLRRGNELDLRADVEFDVTRYDCSTIAVITEISEGEARRKNDSAISVYFGKKGDSLWDVASELCASPDLIREQNPNIEYPLAGGERVILFRPL
jgi:hypothetical protein